MTMLPDIDQQDWDTYQQQTLQDQIQQKIDSFGLERMIGDKVSDLHSLVARPETPPSAPPEAPSPPPQPAPSPEPAPEVPPTQPEPPAATPPVEAAPLNTSAALTAEQPPVAPDVGPPAPPPMPEATPAAPPAPTPTPALAPPSPTPSASSGAGDWFGSALNAVQSAGGDVQQFASNFSSAGDVYGNALNAASRAGADVRQFASALPPPPAPTPPAAPASTSLPGASPVAPQGADVGGVPGWLSDLIAKNAPPELAGNPDFIRTVAAGAKAESGWDPNRVQNGFSMGSGKGARGLFQFDMGGMGAGMDEQSLLGQQGAEIQASRIVPLYAKAYASAPGDLSGAEKASWVAGQAERPLGFTDPASAARRNYASAYNDISAGPGATPSDLLGRTGGWAQQAAERPQISQFGDKQLSADEAYAACGPAAAVRFAQMYGRNPSLREATDLAASVGWSSGQGMAGIGSEKALMDKLGVPTHVVGSDWKAIAGEATTGNPVTISTPGHYFFADGYDASSGAFHVGQSGLDLRGGSEWMTPQQMEARMGGLQGALFADNPRVPAPSTAGQTTAPANYLDRVKDTIGDSFSGLGSTTRDILGALGKSDQGAQDPTVRALDQAVSASANPDTGFRRIAPGMVGGPPQYTDFGQANALTPPGNLLSDLAANPLMPSNIMSGAEQAAGNKIQTELQNNPIISSDIRKQVFPTIFDPGVPEQMQRDQQLALSATQKMLEHRDAEVTPEERQALSDASLKVGGMEMPEGAPLEAQAIRGVARSGAMEAAPVIANKGRAAYEAAVDALTQPSTGAGALKGAMDSLSAYPEEIAAPIRQFANTIDAPASDVANTIQRWMLDNPLERMPDAASATSVEMRGAAQQAVADIADMVQTRAARARGPSMPGAGEGQIGLEGEAQGALPGFGDFQRTMPEGTGPSGLPSTARTPEEQGWLGRIQAAIDKRDTQGLNDLLDKMGLYGERTTEQPGVIPGFEGDFTRPIPEGSGAGGVPDVGVIPDWAVGTRPRGERPPASEPATVGGGNLLSQFGQRIASAMSPTENLVPAARQAVETFANLVGRQSDAVSLIAHNTAQGKGLGAEAEMMIRQKLANGATRQLVSDLQDQGLAAVRQNAPFDFKTATSNPNSLLARYAFHPDVAPSIRAVVDQSGWATNPLGSAVLNAAGTAKGTIFSLSNFHTFTEGLNAAFSSPETLHNYSRAFLSDDFAQGLRGKMASTFEDAARAGVTGLVPKAAKDVRQAAQRAGQTLAGTSGASQDLTGQVGNALWRRVVSGGVGGVGGAAAGYTEAKVAGKSEEEARSQALTAGVAGAALGGLPLPRGIGTVSEALQSALWERAVPAAKATAWDGLVKGGLDPSVAAKVVNERFGGLNYAAMGRSPAFMDATKMIAMAPDWTESTVRQLGSAMFGGSGQGVRAGFLARTLATTMAATEAANYALSGHSTVDNQPGHQFEIEMRDPAGGYLHIGLLPGNVQSWLNEANKLHTDTSAKRGADIVSFITSRLSGPLQMGGEAIQAAGARSPLQMPYGYSKAGPVSTLASLSPISLSQIAQAVDLGGVDPKVAIAMAVAGLNPRYTNPNSPTATTTDQSGTLPVPQQLPPPERLPSPDRLPAPERLPVPSR